jgi:hypothetical protein
MVMMKRVMEKMRIVRMMIQNFKMMKMIALKMMMNQISQMMTMMMITVQMRMLKKTVKVLVGMNWTKELLKKIKRQLKKDNS